MGATERVFENPVHPHTRTLLASVPQLHTRWQDAGPASAPGPSPADVGEVSAACGDGALVEVESDHLVAPFAPEAGGRS